MRRYANAEHNTIFDDDKMSLIDLWDTIIRRWIVFTVTFFICIMGWAVWIVYDKLTSQPKFEAQATIRYALVGNRLYDSPKGLAEYLIERHGLSRYEALPAGNVASTFELRAERSDAESAKSDLSTALEELVRIQMAWFTDERETLLRRHDLSKRVFAHFNGVLSDETAAGLPRERAIRLAPGTAEAMVRLPELYARVSELKRMLDEPYTRPTEVVEPVLVIASPSGPRLLVVVFVALIFGALVGSFTALFVDSTMKARKAREDGKT